MSIFFSLDREYKFSTTSEPLGMDWQWMRAAEFMKYQYRDLGDGTYELMILVRAVHRLMQQTHSDVAVARRPLHRPPEL